MHAEGDAEGVRDRGAARTPLPPTPLGKTGRAHTDKATTVGYRYLRNLNKGSTGTLGTIFATLIWICNYFKIKG